MEEKQLYQVESFLYYITYLTNGSYNLLYTLNGDYEYINLSLLLEISPPLKNSTNLRGGKVLSEVMKIFNVDSNVCGWNRVCEFQPIMIRIMPFWAKMELSFFYSSVQNSLKSEQQEVRYKLLKFHSQLKQIKKVAISRSVWSIFRGFSFKTTSVDFLANLAVNI